MSGQLGEGVEIVARMTALSADGRPVVIAWIVFEGEDEAKAEAFELARDDIGQVRLVPLALGRLSDWQRVAALAAEGGG